MSKKSNQTRTEEATSTALKPEVIGEIRQDIAAIASALLDQMNYTGNRIISGSMQNKLKLRAIIEKYSTPKTYTK